MKKFVYTLLLATILGTYGCGKANNSSITVTPQIAAPNATEYAVSYDCAWSEEVFAWVDQNRNGKHEYGELPLENVEFHVHDPLNNLRDVSDPAKSDWNGKAKLYVWLPGCPNTALEVHATPPTGYEFVTEPIVKVSESNETDKEFFEFGFALQSGYTSPTPYISHLTCQPDTMEIHTLTTDSMGTVWSANSEGIYTFDPFKSTWLSFTKAGAYNRSIEKIQVGGNKIIWINTRFRTSGRYDGSQWTVYEGEDNFITRSIPPTGITPDGFIWFTDTNVPESIVGFNPQTNAWKHLYTESSIWHPGQIWVFTDGVVWRASFNCAMPCSTKGLPNDWKVYNTFIDLEKDKTVIPAVPVAYNQSFIVMNAQGVMWFSGERSITQWDDVTKTAEILDEELVSLLSDRVIVGLSTALDDSLWIIAEGSHPLIIRYTMPSTTYPHRKWETFDPRDGIPDVSGINSITTTESGIWVSFESLPTPIYCIQNTP